MFTGNGGNYGKSSGGGYGHWRNGTIGAGNGTFGRSLKGTAAVAGLRRFPSMNSAAILPMPNSSTKAPPLFRRSATISSSAHFPSIGSANSFPHLTATKMSSSRYSGGGGGGGMSSSYHQDWSSSSARPSFGINNSSLASSSYTPQRYSSSDRINRLSSQYNGSSSSANKYSTPSSYATSSYTKNNNTFSSSTLGTSNIIGSPLRSASYASSGIGLGERLRMGTGGSGTNLAPTTTTIGANNSRRNGGGGGASTYGGGGTGIGSSSLLMSTSLYGGIGGRHHSPTITSPLDRDDNHFYSRHSVGREIRKNSSASNRPSPLASGGYSKSAEYSPPQTPKAKIIEEEKSREKSPLILNELKPKEIVEEKKEMKRSETPTIILIEDGEENGRIKSGRMTPEGTKRSSSPKMTPEGSKRSASPKITPEGTKRCKSPLDGGLANMERMTAANSSRSSSRSRSSISPSSPKSKSPSPNLATDNLERKKSVTSIDKLDEKKKELWNGGGGQKVEFPPPKEKSPVFSQLEKMIKLTAFDQKKFQKQVRVAAGLEMEEAKEEIKDKMKEPDEGKLIKAKSKSRSKSPGPRNNTSKDRNGQKSPKALSRSNSPCPQPSEATEEKENKLTSQRRGRKSASKSRSPSPNPQKRSLSPAIMNNESTVTEEGGKGKRAARRTRTVDNLMDELKNVLGKRGGQNEDEGVKRGSKSRSRSRQRGDGEFGQELGKNSSRLRPPLLLVTSPSMGDADEDSQQIDSMADAQMTLKLGGNEGGGGGDSDGESATASYSDEEYSDEDEEYSDEDEDYTDEEEWESDWDVDEATVCRTLQIAGLQGGYESDFELPFELDKSKEKATGGGGRLPESNALPPPIFTASISYDGMSSDSWAAASASYSDEGTGSWAGYSGPGDDVEVGFTLVQRAAMRDSDDEEFTTTSGSYTSSSGTYTSTSGSSFDENEDEEEEEVEMDHRSQRSYTRSRSMEDRSISRSHRSSTSSSSSSSSSSDEEAQSVHSGDEEIVVKDEPKLAILMPKEAQEIEDHEEMAEMESAQIIDESENMMEIGQLKEGEEVEADGKEVHREATYVLAQKESLNTESTNFLPGMAKPKMDFAKKAVVQGMKEEKAKAAEGAKAMQAPTEAELRKKKEEEEKKAKEEDEKKKAEEKRRADEKRKEEEKKKADEKKKVDEKKKEEDKKKAKEEEDEKKTKTAEKEELDKSAQRKSTLNMRDEEKAKAEREEQERARQQARGIGAVGKARSRFQPSEPIIPILTSNEPIVYKRSAHLEPKPVDEQRQKRVYSPIPKPEPDNGQFDKEMAELREQMKKDKRKLQSEFRDVSSGLKSAAVEAKQKAKEEEHKSVMNKATNAFGRAEEEKRRQKDLAAAETEAEQKKRKELEEKKGKEQKHRKEEEEEVAEIKRPEPKKTIRRAAKEPKVTVEDGETKKESGKHVPRRFGEKPEAKRKTEELMKFTKEETPAPPSVLQLTEKMKEEEKGRVKPMEPKQQQQLEVPSMKKMTAKSEEGVKKGPSKGRRKARRRSTRGHPRRPFTRTPFDIDELMGWRNLDSFEKMDAFFASKGAEKRQMKAGDGGPAAKRRGTEPQKIWISELHDIDKLYKASELRDIKLSAGA